jgi:hypothetical protein
MIDINKETLISISDTPKHLPRRRNGKTVHISAVYRWLKKGIKGIRLESARIAGTTYTSLEALQRWSDALTNADESTADEILQTPKSRERQINQAAKQVTRELRN